MKSLFVMIAVLLTANTASAFTTEKMTVMRKGTKVPVTVYLPDNATNKVPSMIIIHGTGGVSANHHDYAKKFVQMGLAGIIVDSFGARNIKSSLHDQDVLTPREMSRDAHRTLQMLDGHPKIDTDRVGVIGFSKGGIVAMQTSLDYMNAKEAKYRFALHIAMYPACAFMRYKYVTTGKPIKVIVGQKDTHDNPERCIEVAAKMKSDGADVETVVIPDARHAWDVPGPAQYTKPGQNGFNCRWKQVGPGNNWIDENTGAKINGNAAQDRSKCMTMTVSGGYNPTAAAESWKLIEGYVRTLQ